MSQRALLVALAAISSLLATSPAFAGSEPAPTPSGAPTPAAGATPTGTATPMPTPPPGPGGTINPDASPTPTGTPSKKDKVKVFGREVGELPKTPGEGALARKADHVAKGLAGKFPYLRVAAGGGAFAIDRSSTVDTRKTGGSKSDPSASKLRGPAGSMEASLGVLVMPNLLLSGTFVGNYVHVTEIDNEEGPDPELESGGQLSAGAISVDWVQNPKGSGIFAGASLGGGAFSAELPENSVGIQRVGGVGPVLSLGLGYLSQLPHDKWRGGVQIRTTVSPYLRGETERDDVVYRETDRAFGVSILATLSYF